LRVIDEIFLKLDEFSEVTTSVDSEERRQLSLESSALGQREIFLILNLGSEESNKLKSDLVVLESLNVVGVLLTSLLEERADQSNVAIDSSMEPFLKSLSLSEFILLVSEDNLEGITFGFFVLF
jgi:hypothetical protein